MMNIVGSQKGVPSFRVLAAIIIFLYSSLLVDARTIYVEKTRTQTYSYSIVWQREIKTAPPLSPPTSEIALPERVEPLKFYQKECELGMCDNSGGPGCWSGRPFSGGVYPGSCLKVDDLQPSLGNKISAYVVAGYCECEFFDDSNCQTGLFTAFNREDLSLKSNGPHDNIIESVRCRRTDHIDEFVSGKIQFYMNKPRGIYNAGGGDGVSEWSFEVKREHLYTDCIPAALGRLVASYKINGVTCDFFGDEGCTDFKFTAGHGGKYEKKFKSAMGLRSFKCYPPYGIMWNPRDDI
ncbi:hypothetical protein TWF718_008251 [Orbilia javanica]|uniref:Uncharacterized protein n=1 Tax=Orbilia javanica TaxID=47235 RepID=A0AAN8N0R6_9PEZI